MGHKDPEGNQARQLCSREDPEDNSRVCCLVTRGIQRRTERARQTHSLFSAPNDEAVHQRE